KPRVRSVPATVRARCARSVEFRTLTVTAPGCGTTVLLVAGQLGEEEEDELLESERWITRHHTSAVSSERPTRNSRAGSGRRAVNRSTVHPPCWDRLAGAPPR